MLTLDIDIKDLTRGLSALEHKQVPIATVWALNDTAQDVLSHMQTRMNVVFDRPTRFSLNAFMVWRATKQTMVAEVKERPSVGSKHFLKVEERGGVRGKTGLERMASSQVGQQVNAITPAKGAKLNAFGNLSTAVRRNATAAMAGDGRTKFFVPKRGQLSPGVYRRQGKKNLVKVLHFTTSMPSYRKRLGFYDGAEDVFRAQFPVQFAKAFSKAMATRK